MSRSDWFEIDRGFSEDTSNNTETSREKKRRHQGKGKEVFFLRNQGRWIKGSFLRTLLLPHRLDLIENRRQDKKHVVFLAAHFLDFIFHTQPWNQSCVSVSSILGFAFLFFLPSLLPSSAGLLWVWWNWDLEGDGHLSFFLASGVFFIWETGGKKRLRSIATATTSHTHTTHTTRLEAEKGRSPFFLSFVQITSRTHGRMIWFTKRVGFDKRNGPANLVLPAAEKARRSHNMTHTHTPTHTSLFLCYTWWLMMNCYDCFLFSSSWHAQGEYVPQDRSDSA